MRSFIKMIMLVHCTAIFSLPSFAQTKPVLNDIALYESLKVVKEKIGDDAVSHEVIKPEKPSFPLAENSESHLICTDLKTKNGVLAKVVFTFADDKLHYLEARGNAINTLIATRNDSTASFMGYQVYFEDGVFAKMDEDVVWILTKEAIHPNLFVWENPYVKTKEVQNNSSQSGKIPEYIEMGGALDRLRPKLEVNSLFIFEQKLDGSDPNAQLQLNCFGIDYAGFPRKIEARFGDEKLNAVWILTGKGEEDRIRKKLQAEYGNAVFANEDWEIFNDWTIGLRKDKPEVLVLTKELGQFYKKEIFKQ